MPQRIKHRIYGLPVILFVILTMLFISAGVYLAGEEKRARISKAQSVAEQVKISLEVFSNERKQAILNLMQNWPSFEPNKVDWFNAQATSLIGMQRGFSSLTYADENGIIKWITIPSYGSKSRLDNELVGQPMSATGLQIADNAESMESTLVYSPKTQHHHIVVGRAISPQEPQHGFVVGSFDVKTILGVMIGELVGPQFNFSITEGDHVLFANGEFIDDGTVVSPEPFSFITREWTLHMQSQVGRFSTGLLIMSIGVIMSALVSWVFHKQLKGAVNLSVSQKRYQTASEASLDALLIYQPHEQDFTLVEANRYSWHLFHNATKLLSSQPLSAILLELNAEYLFESAKRVMSSGEPVEHYLAVGGDVIEADWLKIQMVKADRNLAVTVRDVTARFQAQQALEKSEEKYRRLVDGMHRHFVYTKTIDHQFVYVSAGIETILGYTPEHFCQHGANVIMQVPDETFQIRRSIQKGQKPEPYLVHYQGTRGEQHVLEFSDTPILDEHGNLVAIEGISRDVTKEQALQAEVIFQANHDQLTGLMNRYAFDTRLHEILEDLKNHDQRGVMCFIDMDRFKLVNDSCGHPAGDKLLKEIANLFREHVSDIDLLARIGGDEFCIIYRNHSLYDVEKKLDKLLDAISNFRFVYEDKLFFVGVSIGVIEIAHADFSAPELIKAADNACYQAKYSGRNRYFVYHETDARAVADSTENNVLNALNKALQSDGFELYSQSIISLNERSSSPQHYEVLLRLPDGEGGVISPGLFIPLAERHGLMNKVDWWVVNNTLSKLENNPVHLGQVSKVAINLSGISLGDEMMLHKISQRMKATTVPAEKVCFEITETTAVTNLNAARHFISTLRKLGCHFALDDFGAGMSSFTYLKNLDIDYVKIDGSFVQNCAHDPIDHATVKAINNIAHSMGKKTVAEFVVDNATSDVLKALNVDFGQGFALDTPRPLSERIKESKSCAVI